MMASPESYIDELKNATYAELIVERKRLLKFIDLYEKREIFGNCAGEDWKKCPSPDVKYQCYLEYLARLCAYMQKKYNYLLVE